MREYILSKEFELIYRSKPERIERLNQFKDCFRLTIIGHERELFSNSCYDKEYTISMIIEFTELVDLCENRINYYINN